MGLSSAIRSLASTATVEAVENLSRKFEESGLQARLLALTQELSRAATTGVLQALSVQIGPDERAKLENMLRGTAHEMSREVSLGLSRGLREAGVVYRENNGLAQNQSIPSQMRGLLHRTKALTTILSAGGAVVTLAAGVYVFARKTRG